MSLSPADQLTQIQQTSFFTALQHQFQAINAAFASANFTIKGVIVTEVDGVPVTGSISTDGATISVSVGQDDSGNALYSWNAPASWVAPLTTPTNTAVPTISGTAQSGQVLTASNGTWSGASITYTYQWQSSGDGTTWANISGATQSSYTVQTSDIGNELRVAVTATNSAGSNTADSAATAAVAS